MGEMSSTTNEWTKGSNRDLDGQTKNFENFISIEYLNLQMGKIRLPQYLTYERGKFRISPLQYIYYTYYIIDNRETKL